MSKQTYQDRNKILKEMGYATYKDYLESTLWKTIRERVFIMKGRKCTLCSGGAVVVHHTGYGKRVLQGLDISPLFPLCFNCHEKVELKNAGKEKKSLAESQASFTKLYVKAKFLVKKLPPEERKGKPGWCMGCGLKAQKKMRHCRKCR